MPRAFRLFFSQMRLLPVGMVRFTPWARFRVRAMSPTRGSSTLMTSAPMSPRIVAAIGPVAPTVQLMTRMPSRMERTRLSFRARCAARGPGERSKRPFPGQLVEGRSTKGR